jgi:MFS family permease
VSEAAGLGRYRAVLRIPHVRPLLGAAFVGRLPIGMISLGIVLLVSEATGSYATAGLVTAVQALSAGLVAPAVGRLIDRVGQTPVLVTCAVAFPASVAALVAVAETDPRPVPLCACAVAFGVSFPPLFAVLRSLLSTMAEGAELTEAAFAMEAVLQELFFIGGPLLVAVLVAVSSPQVALAAAAAMSATGTLAFAASRASRAWRPQRSRGGAAAGALISPGMRTLLIVSAAYGVAFGAVEVAMPAFAARHGSAGTSGVLLAAMAVGSVLGGVLYGARSWRAEVPDLFVRFAALFAIALVPVAFAGSIPAMFVLITVAGFFIAPWAATTYVLVGRLVPPDALTEAFTWETTAVVAGFALGGALSGALVEQAGVREAFLAAAGLAAVSAVVAWTRRATLTAAATSHPRPRKRQR